MADKPLIPFHSISARLHEMSFPEVAGVIAIERGGLYPGLLIAHQLRLPLHRIRVRFRDDENAPDPRGPMVIHAPDPSDFDAAQAYLLVDDVSVTGATFQTAIEQLLLPKITTFALKGKADLLLFPEIANCVTWPWATLQSDANHS